MSFLPLEEPDMIDTGPSPSREPRLLFQDAVAGRAQLFRDHAKPKEPYGDLDDLRWRVPSALTLATPRLTRSNYKIEHFEF